MGINEFLFFFAFLSCVFGLLLVDLGVFTRTTRRVSFKEASAWSAVWVSLAIISYFLIKTYGHHIHGIENYAQLETVVNKYIEDKDELYLSENDFEKSLESYRNNIALKFLTGWLLEYSLSVDNIFVIILIFSSFKVSEKYFKKVLLWGILGAVIMRFLFIFIGSALIQQAHWILYIFGVFLVYSGIKMFLMDDEDHIETDKHPVVRFASRYFSVFPRYVGDRFFLFRKGKLFVTPLFIVVLIIEFTDLLFAVDSVPAVFAVTKDPYIVFFSNIFAVLGLRSMFFFLSNALHWFRYLQTGLAFLLMFIGIKMLAYPWLKVIGFKTQYSLYIIIAILATSILASLLFPNKEKEEPIVAIKQ